MMSSYWVNFMTKGDPNGSGLPQWPQVKELGKSKVMVLGDTPMSGGHRAGGQTDIVRRGVRPYAHHSSTN